MAEHNPYAPPAASSTDRPRLAHGYLKHLYLWGTLGSVGLVVLIAVAQRMGGIAPLCNVGLMAASVAHLVWVHKTWTMMPRFTQEGISPGSAVVRMLIPVYNLWWLFAYNAKVAEGLRRVLSKHERSTTSAPHTLAWVAPAAPLGLLVVVIFLFVIDPKLGLFGLLSLLLAPVLSFVFMARVDSCLTEILYLRAELKAKKEARRAIREASA
jgi:hypothetical protein